MDGDPFTKRPHEKLDFMIDMKKELAPLLDTITNVSWVIQEATSDPHDLIKDRAAFGDRDATIWLRGGIVGKTYTVVAALTTTAGRVYEPYFRITIKN